ncbi:MAG: hypothetical protein J6X58_06660 [Bacteroidales bacterium]|nr:hypothetical protein [Bacteroidales bacterium]
MKELLNKHNQRSCKMKKSTQTVPYNTHSNPWNLKKVLAGIMLVAVPVFVACEKEPVKPNNNNGNGGNTQPQRTEEFIYNTNLKFYRPGSSSKIPYEAFIDTAAKYGVDQNIKQLHITPETEGMFSNFEQTAMENRANMFSTLYDESKSKLSGENTTLVLSPEAFQSQIVQNAFHNKLNIALQQR